MKWWLYVISNFCLQVERDILDHVAEIKAPTYLPTNDVLIPTGTWTYSLRGGWVGGGLEYRGWVMNRILVLWGCHCATVPQEVKVKQKVMKILP